MHDTKERILETTAEQFRRYGYTGTGMKQIVTEASAPFGSIYHFFPGGKEQFGEETIRRSGEMYYEAGIAPERSRELAIEFIALLEGAFVLSRAARSTEPLEVAGANATAAVTAALKQVRGSGGHVAVEPGQWDAAHHPAGPPDPEPEAA